MAEKYTCEACRGTFYKLRSDEEAIREAVVLFGMHPANGEMAIVCDDCFRKLCPTN